MDLRIETVHYRRPKQILDALAREARQQIDADEERLIAWQWAKDAMPGLREMLSGLEGAVEEAEEELARAEDVLAAAGLAIREAQQRLAAARARSEGEVRELVWQEGNSAPIAAPLRESQFADLELEVRDAQRELEYAVTNRGIAQRKVRDAQDRARSCRRILVHFHELKRPETPALDLLWSLTVRERKEHRTGL